MTQREELNDDAKKLNWLLGLEKETLADMAHRQSKIIEKLQKAEKAQRLEDEWVNKAWSETAAFIGWPGLCAECELKGGE